MGNCAGRGFDGNSFNRDNKVCFYVKIGEVMAALISFFVSLLIVIFGAKLFLGASISLSRLLRIPEMVIGATVVSLVTTMPETLVSLFAVTTGHTALALGNIVGSGLVNLGLLFGVILLN